MASRSPCAASVGPTPTSDRMTENPYEAPQAPVRDIAPAVTISAEVAKRIQHAWIAALISGTVTLAAALFAIFGTSILGFSAWELIDAALIFGLAYGIYRKSRTCAVIMFIYFLGSKILIMVEAGPSAGIVMAVVFLYYFWQGVRGTYEYHRLVANGERVAQ